MATPDVDWARFAGEDGGHRFELFCTDLLRAQGYAVEHMAKGGNDEGKDILILQRAKAIDSPPSEIVCLVECKSRTSKHRRAISLEDINRSLWALLENNCSCLVLFSTYKFNSQAVNCFLRVNDIGNMNISWIDQDDLIAMGQKHPAVWRSHFDADPPADLTTHPAAGPIHASAGSRPIFWADSQPLRVLVHNSGPTGGRATLRRDGVPVDEVHLHHHGKRILQLDANRAGPNPYAGLTVTFEPDDRAAAEAACAIDYDSEIESRRRIDHIFADSDGLLPRLLDSLGGGSVHVHGAAGCGKSRLLVECQRKLQRALYVDLSRSDRPDGLLETVVQDVTGWPVQVLARMPADLVAGLSRSAACDREYLEVVADFCGERRGRTQSAVAHALVALASSRSKHLIVDNLQDATELDEAIVMEAMSHPSGLTCLLATRTYGAGLPEKVERIVRHRTRPVASVLDANTPARLQAFVDAASRDPSTQRLLTALVEGQSFQAFMAKLKALRQLGALSVLSDGQLQLHDVAARANSTTYAQLQELILYSRLPAALRQPCAAAIEAAAIFGETFPASFIEHLLGQKGNEALDELERRELIVVVPDPSPYGVAFRFDHALTRDAVLGGIGTIRRTKLHEAAARFITGWPDFQPGSGHYDAAVHLNAAGRVADALSDYETGARHYLESGRVGSGQAGLVRALGLFDRLPIERDLESAARELALRELLLETALLVTLPEDEWQRQIEAFQIQTHLFPGLPGLTRRLGRAQCFIACFDGFRRRIPAAWREMASAIDLLSTVDDRLPLAEAMKWGANLLKNLGELDRALSMGTGAYETFVTHGHTRGAGETATELSHVHYEAYRFDEALEWGNRALGHYGALGHPSLVARARVDIARMLAVLHPTDPETHGELALSIRLARHAGIGAHIAKACMNWGIYLALEIADEGSATARFDDAEEVLQLFPSRYIAMLLRFARIALLAEGRRERALQDGSLGEELIAWCRHFDSTDQIGDRRLQAMLKALSGAQNPAVVGWLRDLPGSALKGYSGIGLGKRLTRLEKANPLFRRGWFATYY